MKTTIKIEHEYDDVFVDTARRIAKCEPSTWLLVALTQFRHCATDIPTPDPDQIVQQMHDAAVYLETWLPIFENLPWGWQCPPDVHEVLDALPRVREYLQRALDNPRRRGAPPKIDHQICAAVVVEAWKLCHGEVERRSLDLYAACEAYWVACGGEPLGPGGDIEKWRRHVEKASDSEWIRDVMVVVRNMVAVRNSV